MFEDSRSKRVIILAHCLLNQNSISDGTADFPSQFVELIEFLMKNKIGMIQLPCPELHCLGLDRGDCNGTNRSILDENTRIRALITEDDHIVQLHEKAEEIAHQIQEYDRYGFQILGVIGVNRSPSCGVETTSKLGKEESGKGVFMKIILETLTKYGIKIPMIGIKTSEPETAMEQIKQFV